MICQARSSLDQVSSLIRLEVDLVKFNWSSNSICDLADLSKLKWYLIWFFLLIFFLKQFVLFKKNISKQIDLNWLGLI